MALQAAQSFMRDMGRTNDNSFARGDHVPLVARHAAAVAFWLPDCLGSDQNHMRSGEAQELWSSQASVFGDSAESVAQRLSA